MRTPAILLLLCALLALALLPWIVSSCAPQPLLPDELRLERQYYEETVEASQDATIEAMRRAEGTHKVIVIGPTGMPGGTSTPGPELESPLPSPTDIAVKTGKPTLTAAITTSIETTSTIIAVSTSVFTQTVTPTPRRIVVRSSTSTPKSTTVTSGVTPSPTSTNTPLSLPAPGTGLVPIQDIITEQMLTEQVKRDVEDTSLTDLMIHISGEGIYAVGTVALFPGLRRPIEIKGSFSVEGESLLAQVNSIMLDDLDVTEQYKWQLEDNFNTSLYRLLPQRYVKSFELYDGQVIVESEVYNWPRKLDHVLRCENRV